MRPDIAVALDVAGVREAVALVDACGEAGTWFKVGPVLFVREGPRVIQELRARGKRVFLDLKWHDIPSTVAGAVTAAADVGVALATVHLHGGRGMLDAAVAAAAGRVQLVGVGVLTSLDVASYGAIVARPVAGVKAEQVRLAGLVVAAGLDGMVCAAAESGALRAVVGGGRLLVVPGVRRAEDAADDQVRVATPAEAVQAGADLLVVGRPVTRSPDPAAALRAFREAMAA